MATLTRCASSLTLLLAGGEAARVSRKSSSAKSKFIAGVPVLNYNLANGDEASLVELDGVEEQEWNVMVKPGTSDAQIQQMCRANKNGCRFTGHPDKGGVPFVELRGTERDLEVVLQNADGAVRYVEPDSEVYMIPEIEAEIEAATWGLNRIGADQRSSEGAGATVFVLDTGVRSTHSDFTGRASPGADVSSGSLVECNGNTNCAGDRQGHGTHCAGTAGGNTYGVAPAAQIRSVKVLSDQGSGAWSWSYLALDWLAVSSVRPAIASMSLGGGGVVSGMRDAVDAATNAGVTVVVAAGNSNSDACGFSPAYVPSAITVGSTDSTDSRSSFSNYGSCVDIWAPGSSVLSLSHRSDSRTATLSGTSMACPHVSGAAALVMGSTSKSASQVINELLNSAERNAISGLKSGDTNALLYVGA